MARFIIVSNDRVWDGSSFSKDAKVAQQYKKLESAERQIRRIRETTDVQFAIYDFRKREVIKEIPEKVEEKKVSINDLKLDQIFEISEIFSNLDDYIEELEIQLSYTDKQQQDLLHYLENTNLNAAESCKVSLAVKEIRKKRRFIKDCLQLLKPFKTKDLTTASLSVLDKKDWIINPVYYPKTNVLEEKHLLKENA